MQEPVVAQEGRTVSFVFSDSSVDRYGDTIDARGWVLDNFKANPVALFGHDANTVENVIGNARNVRVEGNRLIGDIEFMPAETNPNAEVVYQMVKGGYLKTVSVGFQPLEWHLTKDKNRPGGVDFRKQELLEISIVPIPANPNALTQAKAAGLDIERIGLKADAAPLVSKKGMYDVSCLARLLAELGYLQDSSAWEAEYEGDGSEIPQRLADAMNQLGQILVDMTAEEVAELLSDRGAEEPIILVDDPTEMSLSPAQKAIHAFVRGLAAGQGEADQAVC
jgi:HK97 family phage prohead protease